MRLDCFGKLRCSPNVRPMTSEPYYSRHIPVNPNNRYLDLERDGMVLQNPVQSYQYLSGRRDNPVRMVPRYRLCSLNTGNGCHNKNNKPPPNAEQNTTKISSSQPITLLERRYRTNSWWCGVSPYLSTIIEPLCGCIVDTGS